MSMELFMMGLLIVSTVTGLLTEAIKRICDDFGKTFYSNVSAGIASLLISIATSGCYIVFNDVIITSKVIVFVIVLTFVSWLCAMVGYDKVVQAISQIKGSGSK